MRSFDEQAFTLGGTEQAETVRGHWHLVGAVGGAKTGHLKVIRGGKHPKAIAELDLYDYLGGMAVHGIEYVEGLAVARLSFAVSSRDRMEKAEGTAIRNGMQHSDILAFLV